VFAHVSRYHSSLIFAGKAGNGLPASKYTTMAVVIDIVKLSISLQYDYYYNKKKVFIAQGTVV
jgi:hypothetical protein